MRFVFVDLLRHGQFGLWDDVTCLDTCHGFFTWLKHKWVEERSLVASKEKVVPSGNPIALFFGAWTCSDWHGTSLFATARSLRLKSVTLKCSTSATSPPPASLNVYATFEQREHRHRGETYRRFQTTNMDFDCWLFFSFLLNFAGNSGYEFYESCSRFSVSYALDVGGWQRLWQWLWLWLPMAHRRTGSLAQLKIA